jgi:hypothetical protein
MTVSTAPRAIQRGAVADPSEARANARPALTVVARSGAGPLPFWRRPKARASVGRSISDGAQDFTTLSCVDCRPRTLVITPRLCPAGTRWSLASAVATAAKMLRSSSRRFSFRCSCTSEGSAFAAVEAPAIGSIPGRLEAVPVGASGTARGRAVAGLLCPRLSIEPANPRVSWPRRPPTWAPKLQREVRLVGPPLLNELCKCEACDVGRAAR